MSESSYKLSGFARRQPTNRRRQPSRPVQKPGQNQTKVPKGQRSRPKASPGTTAEDVPKRPRLVMPKAAKGIPPFNPNAAKLKTMRMPKQTVPKKTTTTRRRRRLKPMARTLLYTLRLLIVGVGIGAIVGTLLSILDPATRISSTTGTQATTIVEQAQSQPTPTNSPAAASGLFLGQEINQLKTSVQNLAAANPNLTPGIFLVDLETGGYVDVNGSASFPAASTIKVPILVALFQDVDAGNIRLDEMLTIQQEMVAGGSGDMQYKKVGTQLSALEVATKMITISDNTATNMLIARLGGMELLNERFRSWGLTTTTLRAALPDLQGTNTTSPKELGTLMGMVSKGNLVSMPSRDRILDIMRRTVKDTLLPSGLGPGASIAHKTGDIGTMLADAGLVDLPTGKRYIAAVMVQRPNNDPRAEKLISSISRVAYQQFGQNAPTFNNPGTTGTTTPTTAVQPPAINSPLPNTTIPNTTVPNTTVPNTTVPNTTVNPMPPSSYQYPPAMPYNGTGSSMPTTIYQSPPGYPQYYYPNYQTYPR